VFGIVRPEVTAIVVQMSGGREVSIRPVAAAGKRWVGLVVRPGSPEVVKAIAYPGRTELGYSVPFYGGELRPGTYFLTWLRPGQPGPATRGARSSSLAHGATARRSTLRSPTGPGKTAGRPPPCALALA